MSQRLSFVTRLSLGGLAMLVIAACSEKLTTPGDCPALCPGGTIEVFDTVVYPVTGGDTTFTGYITRGGGDAVLLSNPGFAPGNSRPIIHFGKRPDSLIIRDTGRTYTVDSVKISLGILRRDTLQPGLELNLYRIPQSVDTLASLADIDAALTPDRLLGTIPIPDSVKTGAVSIVFAGADLAKFDLAADTGVLHMAVSLTSPAPTGVRLASRFGGSTAPAFTNYVTVDIADTALQKRALALPAFYTVYAIEPADPVPDDNTHVVGGLPSSRVIMRFELPQFLRDSAQLLRATLELVPTNTPQGIPQEEATLIAQGVLADLGAKSPLVQTAEGTVTIKPGETDTVKIEIVRLVQLWQGEEPLPSTVFLRLFPEGSTFIRPTYGSSRSALRPRLRISYSLPFGFENP